MIKDFVPDQDTFLGALYALDYPTHPATTMMQIKKANLSDCERFYITNLGTFPRVNEILRATRPPEEVQRINFWRSEARRKFLNQNRKCINCTHYSPDPKGCDVDTLRAIVSRKNRCQKFEILPRLDTPPEQINQAALDRGTKIHKWIEKYLTTGKPPEYGECNELNQISFLLQNLRESWLMVEELVISQRYQYAGRLDLLAEYDGSIVLFDWTSTGKNFVQAEWYANKFLQAAAYAVAVEEIGLHRVDQIAVVVIGLSRATIFRYPLEQWKQQWIDRVEAYHRGKHQQ